MLVVIPTRLLLLVHLVLLDTILVVLDHLNVLVVPQAFMHLKGLRNAKHAVLEQFPTPLLLLAHLVRKACTPTPAAPNVLAAPLIATTDGGDLVLCLTYAKLLVSPS